VPSGFERYEISPVSGVLRYFPVSMTVFASHVGLEPEDAPDQLKGETS
jgi:hypothetical protein